MTIFRLFREVRFVWNNLLQFKTLPLYPKPQFMLSSLKGYPGIYCTLDDCLIEDICLEYQNARTDKINKIFLSIFSCLWIFFKILYENIPSLLGNEIFFFILFSKLMLFLKTFNQNLCVNSRTFCVCFLRYNSSRASLSLSFSVSWSAPFNSCFQRVESSYFSALISKFSYPVLVLGENVVYFYTIKSI